jgi:hypothetical protein
MILLPAQAVIPSVLVVVLKGVFARRLNTRLALPTPVALVEVRRVQVSVHLYCLLSGSTLYYSFTVKETRHSRAFCFYGGRAAWGDSEGTCTRSTSIYKSRIFVKYFSWFNHGVEIKTLYKSEVLVSKKYLVETKCRPMSNFYSYLYVSTQSGSRYSPICKVLLFPNRPDRDTLLGLQFAESRVHSLALHLIKFTYRNSLIWQLPNYRPKMTDKPGHSPIKLITQNEKPYFQPVLAKSES